MKNIYALHQGPFVSGIRITAPFVRGIHRSSSQRTGNTESVPTLWCRHGFKHRLVVWSAPMHYMKHNHRDPIEGSMIVCFILQLEMISSKYMSEVSVNFVYSVMHWGIQFFSSTGVCLIIWSVLFKAIKSCLNMVSWMMTINVKFLDMTIL